MRRSLLRGAIAAMMLAAGAACMNLGPTASTDTRYYLLEPAATPEATTSALPAGTVIGFGPVSLPPYLDRPQIVTRLSDNRIRVDEFHRWGEPLTDAVMRVLSEDISSRAGGTRVWTFPWKRSQTVSVQVKVAIVGFEADHGGRVALKARWQLLDGDGAALGEHRATLTGVSGAGYGQVVGVMSGLLSDLSAKILESLAPAVR